MVLLRKIDHYLLRSYLIALLVVIISTGLTIIVINMIEELSEFIDHDVPFVSILEYYLFFGGWVLKSFFPMFVLLATLFSVTMLARRSEIMAMNTSGISMFRVALPLLVITAVLATGHFYYNEYVFPPANKRRLEIKKFTIQKKSKEQYSRARNIYRQIRPGHFYTIASFNVSRMQGQDFKMYKATNRNLSEIVTAKTILFRDSKWLAVDGTARYFDTTFQQSYAQFDTLPIPVIADKPDDLAKRMGKPEDMGLRELERYIDLMKRTGGPFLRESIDLKMKYSYPAASVIILFISIPFAARSRRGGIAVSVAAGALIALVYFVLLRVMQSSGYNDKIPENVAAWGVNALFFVIGLIFMLRSNK